MALLAACGDYEPVAAPASAPASADPEVTLRDVDPACVRALLLREMLGQGFTARLDSETALVVGRVRPAAPDGPLTLRHAPAPPEEVIRFNFVALSPRDLRIVLQAALVTNQDTGLARAEMARSSAADAAAFASKMQVAAGRCR